MKRIMMVAALLASGAAQAAYVEIGHAGNAADTSGYGAVGYTYKISDHEVTITEFRQAIGAGSGNEGYWNEGSRTVGSGAPAVNITLHEAMKYCNWLTSGNVNEGAYVFSGGTYRSTDRASALSTYGKIYVLPTEDEWYKAAYFKADGRGYSLYANGTNAIPPAGGGSTGWNCDNVNTFPDYTRDAAQGTTEQNGTVNMMGNVLEWVENSEGVFRGGCFFDRAKEMRSVIRDRNNSSPEHTHIGLRPVEISSF